VKILLGLHFEVFSSPFDHSFLDSLPVGVDPCGERGEYHSFTFDGPPFRRPVPYRLGEVHRHEPFAFRELYPCDADTASVCEATSAGQTLQVTAGSWSQTPTALSDQWQRCNANCRLCTPVTGATGATYTITAADAGHALLAVVQATAGSVLQPTFSVFS